MHDLTKLRSVFVEAYAKKANKQNCSALELLILEVIEAHPEYEVLLKDKASVEKDWGSHPFGNPFLHMALHLSLLEQLQANRPTGIVEAYQRLSKQLPKKELEEKMMGVLFGVLAHAQKSGVMPDEKAYLTQLLALG